MDYFLLCLPHNCSWRSWSCCWEYELICIYIQNSNNFGSLMFCQDSRDVSPVHGWAVLQTLVMPEFGGFLLRPWVWKRWMTWVLLSSRKPTLELYMGSIRRLHACLWKLYFSDVFQEFRSKSYTHGLWFPELTKPLLWPCVMCQKVFARATFGCVSKRDFPEFLKKSGLSAEVPSCPRVLQGGP